MEGFKSSVMAICAVSAGMCAAENLIAGTKFRTQFRLMLNLILAAVIINPFIKGGMNFQLTGAENFELADYGYSQELYAEELKKQSEENISAVLAEQIRASGIECYKIETEVNISEDFSIIINKVTAEAEDFQKAADIIKNTLGYETEVINGNS